MKTFLRRFAAVVWGVLSGFDRVVFKGRLPQLYSPQGMNCYTSANHVRLLDFKALNPLAAEDTARLAAVSDPKWQLDGLRNRDLCEALYGAVPEDEDERKRRSAKVSRLL